MGRILNLEQLMEKETKIPGKVRFCTSHHEACTCREYQFKEMESALKIISVWATMPDHGCPDADFEMIRKRAMDALTCLKGV